MDIFLNREISSDSPVDFVNDCRAVWQLKTSPRDGCPCKCGRRKAQYLYADNTTPFPTRN